MEADPKLRHKIEISHMRTKIEAGFEGGKFIEVEDSTFWRLGWSDSGQKQPRPLFLMIWRLKRKTDTSGGESYDC